MYRKIKRLLDIMFSLIAIILLLPFFFPLAIALKLTGEGYIFYFQDRIGYKNKKFKIWKFATMLLASPNLGTGSITLKNDWRVTPLGKYLRISKINEVPQIINILLGEMSFVGPRPLMSFDFEKFSLENKKILYNLRPGLTGISSIVFRDTENLISSTTMDPHEFDRLYIAPYKGALELWYQKNCSFFTDSAIVLLTLVVILFPKSNLSYKIFKDLPQIPPAFNTAFK